MESPESSPEPTAVNERLELARAMLTMPQGHEPAWPALVAAAFFALSALGFAFGAILAPSATLSHLEDAER